MKKELQLTDIELKMIGEISIIFSKYKDRTRRFGLQLIHSHFAIQKDEVLFETHDVITRTLITRPINKKEIKDAIATSWEITEQGKIFVSCTCCEGPPVDAPSK